MRSLELRSLALCTSLIVILIYSGQILANTCSNQNASIPWSTPSSEFTLHDDGTLTHHVTGLMWMRCSVGQSWDGSNCIGSVSSHTWSDALNIAVSYNLANYTDWRLPNRNELASLLEQRCYAPALNTGLFPNSQSDWYWSSSPEAITLSNTNNAWIVDFYNGGVYVSGKFNDHFVRLVRGGQ